MFVSGRGKASAVVECGGNLTQFENLRSSRTLETPLDSYRNTQKVMHFQRS